MESLNICLLVATYNNARTLPSILDEIINIISFERLQTDNEKYRLIVVDDGSTDETKNLINTYNSFHQISYKKNRGKGYALRQGISLASKLGFRYAITIDSDGQHEVSDLTAFIEKIESTPDALIVGARNMEQASIPGKSSFGHKFSNFWFRFETGINLPDTQSGYRLYPVQLLKKMRFFTNRYEFEIEVLVRAAWKGIKIDSVPVSVYYAPKEERISHFRPFQDFSRVSILNSILVFLAIIYYKPFSFIKKINKENIKKFYYEEIIHNKQSNAKIISSVMLGAFMGIAPIWGYQIIITLIIGQLFRLNKIIAVTVSNISLPPMIPFILWGSFYIGGVFTKGQSYIPELNTNLKFDVIKNNVFQYVTGALILAFAVSVFFGLITFVLLSIFRNKNKLRTA